MFIIAGLGNPGKEYDGTRHNAGFMVIDELSKRYGIDVLEKKHKALVGKGVIDGKKVVLAKPQTYMNLSGESIRELTDYYKVDPKDELLVLCDDIELDVGAVRIRKKGSAGGHNGLKNIILHTGTEDFKRVRMGVGGKPPKMDLADWVLGHFPKAEGDSLAQGIKTAADAAVMIVNDEIDKAMNQFNRKVER